MKGKLLLNAAGKFLAGLLLISLLLFLPAGGFHYWNAWIFLGILFGPMLILGLVLWIKAPELLAKRLKNKEKESEQKQVVALSGLMFIGGFVVSALDFRFGWSNLPMWFVVLAAVLQLVAYGMYAEVMRENAYLSRTVEVQENQKVVDTGLYGVIRHPMYTATILLFLAMPLVLGSLWGFVIFLIYPVVIAKRIRNEEMILEEQLDGYKDYMKKVKYRLIPHIW